MKRVSQFQVLILSLLIFLLLPGNYCSAIPAFARKYQISCQVCHSPAMPRLKDFGNEFSGNGFRMTEFESPRYFIPAGDDKLSLLRELPLAIRMDGFASYNFNDEGKSDFAAPFVLKIISGGELSDKLSYYFYFLFNERGSIAGAEDAFLFYRDLFNSGINLTFGQFSVSDPLFKSELRLTLEPYKIYGVAPGNSTTDLKYDRGIIFDKGFKTGTTLVAEIVNGCGIGAAGEGYLFDKDKYKNIMLRINQSIGTKVSVGIMGYSGKELLTDPGMVFTEMTNEIKMIGPDISVNFDEKFILNMQYVFRNDSQVFPLDGGTPMMNINTRGGFAEIIYSPKGDDSKWYLAGIINEVNSNLAELDYTAATLHAGYMLRRNVRLVTEYTQVMAPESFGRINAGFVTAF